MKNLKSILFFLLIAILFIGCADVVSVDDCLTTPPANFWSGLWHGIISPLSFIFSLFDDDIAMYALNNNGHFYDLGFVLGAGILFGGSSSGVSISKN